MKRLYTPLGVFLLTALLAAGAWAQDAGSRGASQLDNARAALARESASFIANRGQWDARARFLARMQGLDLWVTDDGLVYDLFQMRKSGAASGGGSRVGNVVRMSFVGGASHPVAEGVAKLPGVYNYIAGGEKSSWTRDVPRYNGARINRIYDGIDAAVYFDGGLPRYDLIVAAGADPASIRIAYDGISSVKVNAAGDLEIGTSLGTLTQKGLYAYQLVDGRKEQIACAFTVKGANQVGFTLGAYDRSKPVVIDPLIYSTYIGGGDWDEPRAITTDLAGAGMIYITGFTLSANFPIISGSYQTNYGGTISGLPPGGDVFVTKIDTRQSPSNQIVYSTFIGGPDDETASDIVVDLQGSAFITGVAANTFPTTNDVATIGGRGIFVAKLTPSGGGLAYSTFVADNAFSTEGGIFLNNLGQATVTGSTTSNSFGAFANAMGPTLAGGADAFVAQLNVDGNSLTYATYLGGSGDDVGTDITGDVSAIYVTGYTNSANFPLTRTSANDSTESGGYDAFVARIEPGVLTGAAQLTYGTFYGGSGDDMAEALTVDSFGYITIAGSTSSLNLPMTNPVQNTFQGGATDAFAAKLNPFVAAAGQRMFSTYLGGTGDDAATDLAIDPNRNAYVTGWTSSTGYPTTTNALRPTHAGDSSDAFVTKLAATNGAMVYSTFMGGSGGDRANGIAIGMNDEINITGYTWSANFPTTTNAMQSAHNGVLGGPDGFVTRFAILQLLTPNGGDSLCANTVQNITWTGGTSTNYDIYISSNGGTTYNPVALNVVGNTFAWPIPASFPANNRYRIKVMASGAAESDISDNNFTILTQPTITLQPNNVTQPSGGTAVFTAGASSSPAPTVQWEVLNGAVWTPIPGATSTTLTLNNVNGTQSGGQYRAVFTNRCASVATNVVTLTVSSVRLIMPNGGETWCAGTSHQITWDSGSANGPFDLAVSSNNGQSWQTITTGVNGGSYTWAIPGTYVGTNFLVQVRLSNGQTGDISDAPFTVNSPARISKQPVNTSVNAGSSTTFTFEGSGVPAPTIEWQINNNGTWTTLPGVTGGTLGITGATLAQNGTRYRVIYSNECASDTSREATLTVNPTSGVDDATTGLGALRLTVAPNPIVTTGELRLAIPSAARVRVDVTDINGNVVAHLADKAMTAGEHSIAFNTAGIPSGAYLIVVDAGGERRMVKVTVAK